VQNAELLITEAGGTYNYHQALKGYRKDHYSIKPVINGLSDHGTQLKAINNIKTVANNYNCRKQTTLINDLNTNEITNHLINENSELVYNSHGLDFKLNTFLNILRIF
jgi:hypothetical protein